MVADYLSSHVCRRGKHSLWVATGSRADNPHANMLDGFLPCMRFEYLHLNLQMLDIDCIHQGTSTLVAEHLLRLEILDQWSKVLQLKALLWSLETEVYVEEKKNLIARLYPAKALNKRYNTGPRRITEVVNPDITKILLEAEEGVSLGAAAAYDDGESEPPSNGDNGYTSTKWAAEMFLRRVAASTNIPITIHRPSGLAAETAVSDNVATEQKAILEQLTNIASHVGTGPASGSTQGSVCLVPVADIVRDIFQAVLAGVPSPSAARNDAQMLLHNATIQVTVDAYERHVDNETR
jgi:hypothetical protein